jgi:protein-S-isoprenylcysteine O-methyltransferase Ste14
MTPETNRLSAGRTVATGFYILIFQAFILFLSGDWRWTLVRIQKERNHRLISTGVYGFVRHPMYLGSLLMILGTPLLLGSYYGLVAGLFLSILLIIRISGEERVLVKGLDGYAAYRSKVRYRLFPCVWKITISC